MAVETKELRDVVISQDVMFVPACTACSAKGSGDVCLGQWTASWTWTCLTLASDLSTQV